MILLASADGIERYRVSGVSRPNQMFGFGRPFRGFNKSEVAGRFVGTRPMTHVSRQLVSHSRAAFLLPLAERYYPHSLPSRRLRPRTQRHWR